MSARKSAPSQRNTGNRSQAPTVPVSGPATPPTEAPPAYTPSVGYAGLPTIDEKSGAYSEAGMSKVSDGTFGEEKRRTADSMTTRPRSVPRSIAGSSRLEGPGVAVGGGGSVRSQSSHPRSVTSARSDVGHFMAGPPSEARSASGGRSMYDDYGYADTPPPSMPSIQTEQLSTYELARQQVISTTAYKAARSFEQVDSLKVGVYARHAENDTDERDMSLEIAQQVAAGMRLHLYVFALLSMDELGGGDGHFVLCASSAALVEKAAALAGAKFMDRVVQTEMNGEAYTWLALLEAPPTSWMQSTWSAARDEEALWHVLTRVAQDDSFGDPHKPPPGSRGIDDMLASARSKLSRRATPQEAFEECALKSSGPPAILVDIRPERQRKENGGIPGALVVERNVLEWRFDPRCDAKLDIANRYDLRVIIFCQEGYTSSLAAASLVEIGLLHATDIAGGFRAWKEAGLPTTISDAASDTDSLSEQ